jgi:hypothetical protein
LIKSSLALLHELLKVFFLRVLKLYNVSVSN